MAKVFVDFRYMPVWQNSFSLLKEGYKIIKTFPSDERYALSDDLKRAANSVCHNIAEGYGRFEPRDKSRLYKISRGSSFESISQLLVADSQKYIAYKKCEEMNALIFTLDK